MNSPEDNPFAAPEASPAIIGDTNDNVWMQLQQPVAVTPVGVTAPQIHIAEQEVQHEPRLQQELREYRRVSKYAEAATAFGNHLRQETTIDRIMESGNFDKVVDLPSWVDCQLKSHIGQRTLRVVSRAFNVPTLFDDARHLGEGETIVLPFGIGGSFVVQNFDGKPNSITYRVRFATEQPRQQQLDDAQTLWDQLHAPTRKYDTVRARLADQLEAGALTALSEEVFSFNHEADEVMSFVAETEFGSYKWAVDGMRSPVAARAKFIEYLYKLPSHYAFDPVSSASSRGREGIHFDEHGNITKILIGNGKGIYAVLQPTAITTGEVQELEYRLGYEIDDQAVYAERDSLDQNYEDVLPFIETSTATEILQAFEAVGLGLQQRIKDAFAEKTGVETGDFTRRYGNGYADLSREVGKLVNDMRRPLTKMFTAQPDLAERIASLPTATDPGAQLILGMLREIVSRVSADGIVTSDLPLSAQRISMLDGSCMDIELYLSKGGRIGSNQDQAVELYQSSYKLPTVITLEDITFNGVHIPAGSLFAMKNDGYIFMRFTGYNFDDAQALQTFGQQEAANRTHFSYASSRPRLRNLMNR